MEETRHGTERRIYRCKSCGYAKRVDVRYSYKRYETNSHMGYKSRTTRPVYENYEEPKCYCVKRPGCDYMPYVAIKGVKTEKKCGAKCQNSHGPSCECSCGGENHGRGLGL